jgi:orotate phosphoribosyltransferase
MAETHDDTESGAVRARLLEIVRERSFIEVPPGQELRLSSGAASRFYFDMKRTIYHPEGSGLVADLILATIAAEGLHIDAIGGLEVGAIPIAAAVALRSHEGERGVPGLHVRKAAKGHGTRRLIEGYLEPGWNALLVEDVTTTGGSVLRAIAAVREYGCTVGHVITIVDRREGAEAALADADVRLLALLSADDFPRS